MASRYFVPRFFGEESVTDLSARIIKALKYHGAIRIMTNKRAGVFTFALEDDSLSNWQSLFDELKHIHENCVPMSYRLGEDLRGIYGAGLAKGEVIAKGLYSEGALQDT